MLTIEYPESTTGTVLKEDSENSEQAAADMSENAPRVERQLKASLEEKLWCLGLRSSWWAGTISRGDTFGPSQKESGSLSFQNITGDPNKEYLADGLTEGTISQLGRLNPEQVGVIARTSVMGYKHKDERLDQIGRDLSVLRNEVAARASLAVAHNRSFNAISSPSHLPPNYSASVSKI